MKILQLSPRVPYPVTDGGAIGIFNITKFLALRGHDITMVALGDSPRENLDELRQYCKLEIVPFKKRTSLPAAMLNLLSRTPYTMARYQSREAAELILNIARSEKFDLVHVDHLHMAYYGKLVKDGMGLPVVLREHNRETTIIERFAQIQANPLIKLYAYLESKKLHRFEAEMCRYFDRCLMVSREDEARIMRMSPHAKTAVVAAGIDPTYFYPLDLPEEPLSIVSVASMDWRPNVDGVLWFCDKVFPLIRRECPSAKFYIIGKNTPKVFQDRASDNVVVKGFVPDVREPMARAAVVVAPLRVGSGMRVKIVNAFAMGKAVVSTSISCEGLEVTPGRDISVADTPESFAQAVLDLLSDEKARRSLAEAGLELVKAKHQWPYLAEKLEGEYLQIVGAQQRCS